MISRSVSRTLFSKKIYLLLTGYCDVQRDLEQQQNNYVQLQFASFIVQPAEFSSEIAPLAGKGLVVMQLGLHHSQVFGYGQSPLDQKRLLC